MDAYEIRILREDGSPAFTILEMHLNDKAAIRSGKFMARGRPFEVWCGTECVFGHDSQPPPRPPSPAPPAA